MQGQTEPQQFDSAELDCITGLKIANELQGDEKTRAQARGFQQLGDIYQNRGRLLHDPRQSLKAITLYQLALACEQQLIVKCLSIRQSEVDENESNICELKGSDSICDGKDKREERIYNAEYKVKAQTGDVEIISQEDAVVVRNESNLDPWSEYKLSSTQIGLIRKIKDIEASLVHSFGLQVREQTVEAYWHECQEAKDTLHEIRQRAKNELAVLKNQEITVQMIYQHIAEGLKSLVREMIRQSMDCLPPPSGCIYSFIALGSLARAEATPYSDFEFAILFQDQGEERNKVYKDYFRNLTYLIWIKVLNLGETTARMMDIESLNWMCEAESPCRKGFSFDGQMEDGCHTPLGNLHHTKAKIARIRANDKIGEQEREILIEKVVYSEYELIGTPEELAQFQAEKWESKRGFQTVLSTVEPILSNDCQQHESLIQIYEEKMQVIFNRPIEGLSISLAQQRSLRLSFESGERFQCQGGRFEKDSHYFDVKYHLYRLPNMLIEHLASYFNIRHKSSLDRIKQLFGPAGKMPNISALNNLNKLISEILRLRLTAYLLKGYGNDHLIMLDPIEVNRNPHILANSIGITQDELIRIYIFLLPLQWAIKEFVESNGDSQVLMRNRFHESSHFVKGWVYALLLDYNQAAREYETEKIEAIKLWGAEHQSVAKVAFELGRVYEKIGNYERSLEEYNEAERIDKESYGNESLWAAQTIQNRGNTYKKLAEYDKALRDYLDAEAIYIKHYGREDISIAEIYNNIGVIKQKMRDYNNALALYHKAIEIKEKVYGTRCHSSVADTLLNIGGLYAEQGIYDSAKQPLEEARMIYQTLYGSNHDSMIEVLMQLGKVYLADGKFTEAENHLSEAKSICIKVYGKIHPLIGNILDNMGSIYTGNDLFPQAIEAHESAMKIFRQYNDKKGMAGGYLNLGNVYCKQENYPDAIDACEKAKCIFIEIFGDIHPQVAEAEYNLGVVYQEQDKYALARSSYLKALTIFQERKFEPSHPFVIKCKERIAELDVAQAPKVFSPNIMQFSDIFIHLPSPQSSSQGAVQSGIPTQEEIQTYYAEQLSKRVI